MGVTGQGDGPATETFTSAEGSPAIGDASTPDLPPRFRVTRVLGRGGMGIVVEAHDRALGREVAVKYLPADRRGDERAVRFVREARAAALVDHPGIVTVYDVDPEGTFIVMELVRGESLAQRLARGALPVDETLRISRALLVALAAAHDAGVVHRDVKPGNVLLGDDVVKLADFGVATFGDLALTSTGIHVGTPAYMAPEQLRGRGDDPRVDVYAAGATIFEMLTGRRLHGDDGPCADPAAVVRASTGSRRLAAAIAAAVQDRPEDRPRDASAFLASLQPPARRARGPRVAAIGIAAGAVIAAGALMLRARAGAPPTVPAKTPRVAIAVFDDRTADPRLDYAAAGLPHLLTTELQRIGRIDVVDRHRFAGLGPDAWWAAARAADTTDVVEGVIEGAEPHVRVELRVRGIDGRIRRTYDQETSVSGVPDVVRRLAIDVAATLLGRSVEPPVPRRLDAEAEPWVERGIAALEMEEFEPAVGHLRHAIAIDAGHSEARYYLAIAQWWQSAPADEVRGTISQIDRKTLTEAQRAFLDGLGLLLDRRYGAAIDSFAGAASRLPEDRDVLYGWFEALFHGGRPVQALDVYRRLRVVDPHFQLGVLHVIEFEILHGNHDGLMWAISLVDRRPGAPGVGYTGAVEFAERRYRAAIDAYQAVLDAGQTPPRIVLYLRIGEAQAYALDGQLAFARSLARGSDPGIDSDLSLLWGLAAAAGDPAEVHAAEDAYRASAADAAPGATRMTLYMTIAVAELAANRDPTDLARAATDLARETPADRGGDMVPMMVHVMLGCRTGDSAALDAGAAAPFEDVRAAVAACRAEQRGALDVALALWRDALAMVSDGRLALLERLEEARLARALARWPDVRAACYEVIAPRVPVDAWGMAMPRCRLWTIEAALATGDRAAAETELATLAKVRAPGDPVLAEARAKLAATGAPR